MHKSIHALHLFSITIILIKPQHNPSQKKAPYETLDLFQADIHSHQVIVLLWVSQKSNKKKARNQNSVNKNFQKSNFL